MKKLISVQLTDEMKNLLEKLTDEDVEIVKRCMIQVYAQAAEYGWETAKRNEFIKKIELGEDVLNG